MTILNCEYRRDCTNVALIVSFILGIIAAFLQITAVITVTPVFFLVALGIAIVYLAVTLIAGALSQSECCENLCSIITAVLVGILGTVVLSIVLLAIEFVATSILGAVLTGALLFFFFLIVTSTACLIRCLFNCND